MICCVYTLLIDLCWEENSYLNRFAQKLSISLWERNKKNSLKGQLGIHTRNYVWKLNVQILILSLSYFKEYLAT